MPSPLITLTSDFGLDDCYVGVMKGVILSGNPSAQIVDLCHAIPPHDISQAAYLIHANFGYFPAKTLHVIVVDPGVGSNRKILLAEAFNHLFLAPDNGVLSRFILTEQVDRAFTLDREDLYLTPTSQTFHGRDIFAPVAAFLSKNNPPSSIGPECDINNLAVLNLPYPQIDTTNSTIEGKIISIDHFGNLVTNITSNDIATLISPEKLELTINGHTISGLQSNYTSTPKGSPLLLFNSANFLEIAISQGNAKTFFNASLLENVLLTLS